MGDFPDLQFVLNGGVQSLDEAVGHLSAGAHGVMIGRAVYNNPLLLATADSRFFGVRDSCVSRRRVIERYLDYCDWAQSSVGPARVLPSPSAGGRVQRATSSLLLKPVHNLCVGLQHNSRFRVALNDEYVARVQMGDANPPPRVVVEEAIKCLNEEDLDAAIGAAPGDEEDRNH